jgi:flagellar biosynthesis/type III secretory pathway protein FliH
MTLFDKPKRPAAWEPDPLLAPVQSQPHFLRVNWNEKQAKDFGPWRVAPLGEPLDAVEVPQDELAIEHSADAAAHPDAESADAGTDETPMSNDAESAAMGETSLPQEPGVLHSPDELQRIAQAAHAQGWAEGHAQAQAELAAQHAAQMALLGDLMNGLHALNHEPQRFFEPLKRLALHMAEQLVRGELQVSGQAVANLVKQALDTLGETREKVILHLHPMDADALSEAAPELVAQCSIESDQLLQRGSVRVSVNDTVVEDLIEHRLEALARRVLAQPDAWLKQSSLMHPVSPVTPRWAAPASKSTVTEVEDVQDLRETSPPTEVLDPVRTDPIDDTETDHDRL